LEGKKINWIGWSKVYLLVESGGLGIKDVGKFSDDFLAKWKWRLGLGVRGMWRDILDSR